MKNIEKVVIGFLTCKEFKEVIYSNKNFIIEENPLNIKNIKNIKNLINPALWKLNKNANKKN